MRTTVRRGRSIALGVAALAVAVPGTAQAAAGKPIVTTKAPSNITYSSVQMNGSVNPNGAATTYFFQIGTTSLYGSDSQRTPVGDGAKAVNVSAPAEGLAPATTYHYRIVAINSKGITKGSDRTFKTRRQPLGLNLNATENPIPYTSSTQLTGTLTGTGNADQKVVLQSNPWPYTQGFVNAGNTLLTDANGAFTFTPFRVGVNTQYRVVMPDKPAVASPIVALAVKVRLGSSATPHRVRRGSRVRFSGTIVPGMDGQLVFVQRRSRGSWRNVARTIARHRDSASSSFRRRVKVRRDGRYRVVAWPSDGAHAPNVGRTFRIRVR